MFGCEKAVAGKWLGGGAKYDGYCTYDEFRKVAKGMFTFESKEEFDQACTGLGPKEPKRKGRTYPVDGVRGVHKRPKRH